MRISPSGWVLIALAAAVTGVVAPTTTSLGDNLTGPSFPAAAVALASAIALALSCWTLLVAAVVVAGGSSRLVGAVAPPLLRRALLAGAAGALAVGPAHAEQVRAPLPATQHSVSGLPLPDRPAAIDRLTVRPGDTLWSIAARSLPDDATDARIARATARWYDANRDVIGDDPDLIVPDQRLVPPTEKDPS